MDVNAALQDRFLALFFRQRGGRRLLFDRWHGAGALLWAQPNVDPMLALRNIACNDRWAEARPQTAATLRQQAQQRTAQRRHQRQLLAATVMVQPTPPPAAPTNQTLTPPRPSPQPPDTPEPRQPRRPPPEHPWRRMPIGRARYKPALASPTAKL